MWFHLIFCCFAHHEIHCWRLCTFHSSEMGEKLAHRSTRSQRQNTKKDFAFINGSRSGKYRGKAVHQVHAWLGTWKLGRRRGAGGEGRQNQRSCHTNIEIISIDWGNVAVIWNMVNVSETCSARSLSFKLVVNDTALTCTDPTRRTYGSLWPRVTCILIYSMHYYKNRYWTCSFYHMHKRFIFPVQHRKKETHTHTSSAINWLQFRCLQILLFCCFAVWFGRLAFPYFVIELQPAKQHHCHKCILI